MPKQHLYYVYILTNKNNTVIYIGVTNNLQDRVWQHKVGANDGFTKKYGCNKLVYYEEYQFIQDAIAREKQLKAAHAKRRSIWWILKIPVGLICLMVGMMVGNDIVHLSFLAVATLRSQ